MIGFLLQAATTAVLDTTQALAGAAAEATKEMSLISMLFKGGFMMIPLMVCLAAAIFFIIERFMFYNKRSSINEGLVRDVLDKLYAGNIQGADAICLADKSALGNVLQAGVGQLGKPIDHIEKALDIQANIEINEMEKRSSYISLISGIAPRLGFIGTIVGVIKIFYDIALSGGNIAIDTIAAGLYQKMITSGSGLIVGVIAFTGFHLLLTKIDNYSMRLQKQIFEFVKGIQKPVK